MTKEISEFLGLGGVRLCMQTWRPEINHAKATVILMHGGCCHSDVPDIVNMATYLVERGYTVYSYDQRGFGRSEGKRMSFEKWEDIRGDFSAFLRLVHAREPGSKVFAYGHSFGSCQVMDQAIISPHLLSGIIPASFSTISVKIPAPMAFFISFMGTLFPNKVIPSPCDVESFPGARELLKGNKMWMDPLCPATMTIRFFRELSKRQSQLSEELSYITIPVLQLQGAVDNITTPDRSIGEKIGTDDYTFIIYDDTGHDIMAPLQRDKLLKDMANWLDERSR